MISQNQHHSSKLSLSWFKGAKTPQEKEVIEKMLRNDKVVLGRLQEIIKELKDELERDELSSKDFDETPNWALKQASRLGEKRGLNKVLTLLSFIDGE